MSSERRSGIELLRLFAGCAVIVLHYNYYGGGLEYATGMNYYFLLILECICIVAVNAFILITGYFNCYNTEIRPLKIIQLLVQVILFGGITYILKGLMGGELSVAGFLLAMLPNNYFVILYIVLYLMSPYINRLMKQLTYKQLFHMLVLIFVIFSVYATGVDVLGEILNQDLSSMSPVGAKGSQEGYTIVNFLLCYCLGSFVRMNDMVNNVSVRKVLIVWGTAFCGIVGWSICLPLTAWEYCNPLLIIQTVAIFVLCCKLNFKSKVVNSLAQAAFTCFLVHLIFIPKINISEAVTKSFPIMLCHVIISVVGIYLICWIIDIVYKMFMKPIFNKLEVNLKR